MKHTTNHLRKAIAIFTNLNSRWYVVYPVCLLIGFLFALKYVLPHNVLTPDQVANIDSIYMWVRSEFFGRALNSVSGLAYVPIVDHESAYYYYLAYIAKVIGKSQPWELFLFIQTAAVFILYTVYPLLINRLTRSWICSFLSMLLLHYFFSDSLLVGKSDSAWAYSWVIAFAVPLVGILLKSSGKYTRKEFITICLLCYVISIANVVRTNASLPVFVIVLLILIIRFIKDIIKEKDGPVLSIFRRLFNRRAMIIAILALIVSYGFMNSILPQFAFKTAGYKQYNFGPWHTAYIGFGFEENPYGIEYSDGVAIQKVASINPKVKYTTTESMDEYMAIIKAEYFKLYKENPEYFISSYIRKLKSCIANTMNFVFDRNINIYIALASGLTCFVMLFMRTQRRFRLQRYLLPSISMIAIGLISMLPAMIAVPGYVYLRGSIATGQMILMMMVLFAVKAILLLTFYRNRIKGVVSVNSPL